MRIKKIRKKNKIRSGIVTENKEIDTVAQMIVSEEAEVQADLVDETIQETAIVDVMKSTARQKEMIMITIEGDQIEIMIEISITMTIPKENPIETMISARRDVVVIAMIEIEAIALIGKEADIMIRVVKNAEIVIIRKVIRRYQVKGAKCQLKCFIYC